MRNIISHKEGKVVISHFDIESGYHLNFDCDLPINTAGMSREELLNYCENYSASALEGVLHPGYVRVTERICASSLYVRLVPVTKFAMREYVAQFEREQEGLADLEASLRFCDNTTRDDAIKVLYELLDEAFLSYATGPEDQNIHILDKDYLRIVDRPDYNRHYIRLLPVTKTAMQEYIEHFNGEKRAVDDLKQRLKRIRDNAIRSKSMAALSELLE